MNGTLTLICIILLFSSVASAGAENITYENLSELGAFNSTNNFRANSSELNGINVSDYYLIDTMTSWNDSKSDYDNMVTIIGAPITYGGSDDFAGSWFYAFLMLVVLIFTYGKSKSIEVTSMVMLLISLTVVVASLTNVATLPASFMNLMYIASILGVVGVLYSFLGDD